MKPDRSARARQTYVFALLMVLSLLLAGCVTTIERSEPVTYDKDDAFKQHIRLALQYIGAQNRELAHAHLDTAKKIRSKSPELFHAYALLFQLQREPDLAEEYFRKAIAADRNFTLAHYNYGTFLYNLGRYQETIEQMRIVGKDLSYDRRPQSYLVLGLSQRRLGDDKHALASLEKATQLQPLMSGAYLEAAEIYFDEKNFSRAQSLLKQYNQLSRPTPGSLWLGVQLEAAAGNKDGMASEGLKLKNMFPDSQENQLYQEWLKKR